MKRLYNYFYFILFLFSPLLLANDAVSIQLKWKHSFQFAGYYAAIEKGFYADEGLDVTLKEVDFSRNYMQSVIDGASEYGVSDSSLLVAWMEHKPVVLVAQIFQYSPLVLLSHKESNITTPYDMVGKKIMYSFHNSGGTPFNALFLKTVKDLDKLDIQPFRSYEDFIDRKVDVISAYSTSQPYWLKQQGIAVNIIDPKSYGIDLYGDNLFTTRQELREHPDRVARMRRATLKGWEYALGHQEEMIDLIHKKYAPDMGKDFLAFQAKGVYQMIMPDLIDLGSVEFVKYAKVAKIYRQLKLIQKDIRLDQSFFYTPDKHELYLSDTERKWIKEHPVIRVGGGPDWAPFDFVNSDGNYSGIAYDYLRLIAKKSGLHFKVIVDKWSHNLQKIKNGKLDLLHAVYYTKERAKFLAYTDPYFEMLDYFFIRNDLKVETLHDLDGKRVAIPKGYAHADILRSDFPEIKIVTVDTFSEAIDAVLQKRADILFDTYASLSYVLKREGISTIVPFHSYRSKHTNKLHMAAPKGQDVLVSILNKGLAAITPQERERIYKRWIGNISAGTEQIRLTVAEREWLFLHPDITYTALVDRAPFSFKEPQEKSYKGILADYLAQVAKSLDVTFSPVPVENRAMLQKLADEVGVDIVAVDKGAVVMQKGYRALAPLYKTPVVIVMSQQEKFINDLDDIAKKRIAVLEGYGYAKRIQKEYRDITFVPMKESQKAFEAILAKKIDAVVLPMAKATYDIKHFGFTDLKIVGKSRVEAEARLYVRSDLPQLYAILSKAIAHSKQTISSPNGRE